jgi:thiol-disulfide isomerase/thioredoxin
VSRRPLTERGTIALALLCAGFIALSFSRQGGSGQCALLPYNPVPSPRSQAALVDWELPDLEGRQHSAATGPEEVKVVSFWASWCVNCRREKPVLEALQETYGERGLQVLAISLDDGPPERVRAAAVRQEANFPILIPGSEARERLLGAVRAVPTTLVFGPGQRLLAQREGAFDEATLRALIEPHLRPAAAIATATRD